MFWPCETRTSTCRSFATISSGLYRFLAIAVLLDVKDIPQVGPLQWGWIKTAELPHAAAELIGWENSDAQDHSVCRRCLRLDRDWFRSMGGVARQSACFPFVRSGDGTVPDDGERKGDADR